MYRALYRAAGAALAAAGHLAAPDQVFYLTEDELEAALHGRPASPPVQPGDAAVAPDVWLAVPPAAPGSSWHEVATARQAEFARYRTADVAGRVTVPASPHRLVAPAEERPAGELRGTGCFPGQVEGEVLVVRGPEDSLAVAGKIVCALRTDPGWAALFPACRAVAIERGSSLSHSVILLRELGIPTILNVPGLTRHLHSGQRVHFDGQAGTLRVLPGVPTLAPDAPAAATPAPAAHAHL